MKKWLKAYHGFPKVESNEGTTHDHIRVRRAMEERARRASLFGRPDISLAESNALSVERDAAMVAPANSW